MDDWRGFLAMEPNGCFVAEWNGERAGTATTIVYGPDLAWIGMVLVHPDFRRRGIGEALLQHCITYLHKCGVRTIKLDATPLGKKVYDNLGFRDELSLTRWECVRLVSGILKTHSKIREWRKNDLSPIDQFDAPAFGVSRLPLLQSLAKRSRYALVKESVASEICGYGMVRTGSCATYLGPISATSAATGKDIVEALLSRCNGERIFWDIPDDNAAAVDLAREYGFAPQRPLVRMYLGANSAPCIPDQQFALAGPEVG
jgi:GNAT superfamily N-acetyltransferase